MLMQLFHSPPSPFARKVRVALIETGLDAQTEEVLVKVTPLNSGDTLPAVNPLGKLPAMRTETGQSLHDSRVICRYLDAKSGGGLYPTGEALWDTLVRESMADGIMDAAVLMVYEGRVRPEAQQSTEWLRGQSAKIDRALTSFETEHLAKLEQMQDQPDMAALALAVALEYMDFRQPWRDWRSNCPGLAAWLASIRERPSLAATRPAD